MYSSSSHLTFGGRNSQSLLASSLVGSDLIFHFAVWLPRQPHSLAGLSIILSVCWSVCKVFEMLLLVYCVLQFIDLNTMQSSSLCLKCELQ